MRTNPISQQCEHQGTYSLISMESFAHEVRVRVGVRSTDRSSVSQIFLNEMYQLLMDPSHLTTSKLLLVCSKLKAPRTQSFPNIAAHSNHLGSLKTTAVCLSPAVSVTSLLLGVHWEGRFLNAPHIGILICSKVWKPLILELLMYWRNGIHSC